MRKLLLLFLFICGLVLHAQAQKNVELSSPNGEIKVSVRLTDKIYYDVACNDEVLLKDNYLQLKLKDKILGEHPKLSGQKQNKIKETLTPVVPLKFSTINNEYNQLLLNFKGNYSVEFRAFNDGIAYRFKEKSKYWEKTFHCSSRQTIYYISNSREGSKQLMKSRTHTFPVTHGNHRIKCPYFQFSLIHVNHIRY